MPDPEIMIAAIIIVWTLNFMILGGTIYGIIKLIKWRSNKNKQRIEEKFDNVM